MAHGGYADAVASPAHLLSRDTEQVTAYHWLVVIIGSAGWLFDCMDQRLFILAREPALRELLGPAMASAEITRYAGTRRQP